MLRSILIYLSKASWAKKIVTQWSFARRAASRFIAGERLDDAIQVVKDLNAKGINATLDELGEHTTTPERACFATQDILRMLKTMHQAGVCSNVSIKLTQIGLALDENLCAENLQRILETAKRYGTFVRIDMEDSQWVEKTIGLYRRMIYDCRCENVGVVIQAYLYRSQEDVARLVAEGARVRLCKGAYKEPPEVAFPQKKDVDTSFDRLTAALIDGAVALGAPVLSTDGKIPPIPAIASHDEKRIGFAKSYARDQGLPKQAIEFQMLHGIRRDLQDRLSAEGYPVRVYVPWGTEWYPYYIRRLAERPANVWFFISNYFRK
jgi:proline dehydrogenase